MFFCMLLANAAYATADEILSVVDDAGNTVMLTQPAQRIVSLAPHITELLYAAGAGDKVVGVVAYSDFPEAAKKVSQVGSYNAFDLETILALRPDLIVAWKSSNPTSAIQKLQAFSIPVFFSEPRQLEDVATNLRRLGKLTGSESVANAASATFMRKLSALRNKYKDVKPVSVFYQIWHQPLMTINGEHIISQVIELCGGRNVFADLPTLAPKISLEPVLHKDPEVIVTGNSALIYPSWKDDWARWPTLRAVKNEHLFYINPDIIQRHTPRILQGTEVLCEQLSRVRASSS